MKNPNCISEVVVLRTFQKRLTTQRNRHKFVLAFCVLLTVFISFQLFTHGNPLSTIYRQGAMLKQNLIRAKTYNSTLFKKWEAK